MAPSSGHAPLERVQLHNREPHGRRGAQLFWEKGHVRAALRSRPSSETAWPGPDSDDRCSTDVTCRGTTGSYRFPGTPVISPGDSQSSGIRQAFAHEGTCKWRAGKALRARRSSQRLREIRADEGGTYERVRTDERLEASSRSGRNSSLTPDEHRLEQAVEIHEKRIVRTGER